MHAEHGIRSGTRLPMRVLPRVAGLAGATLFSGMAFAQAAPDAGALSRQNPLEHGLQLPAKSELPPLATPQTLGAPSGETLSVRAFRFAGNSLLSDAQLAPALAPFLAHPIDFAQLQQAAAAVAAVYRQAGWIVRSYLPQQDVVDGVVTIQIVEARFGVTRVAPADSRRVAADRLVRMVQAQQAAGEPVQAGALDRALLLIGDLPGIEVSGSLRAGANDRETDLLLKVVDRTLVDGHATLDNEGSRFTGAARALAHLALQSPSGHGERVDADVLVSAGSRFLWLGASLPVGDKGWRLGLNGSQMDYHLVAPEFAATDAHGSAGDLGLQASFAIVRERSRNLYLNLGADHKTFDNQSTGAVVSHYGIDALTLGLGGNRFDDQAGGGSTSAQASLVLGRLDLNGSPNQAADAATTRAAGSYTKLQGSISRQQAIGASLSASLAWSGQAASKNLDSSEKFYLGGAQGVRAYPLNEGAGSAGQLLSAELRWALPRSLNATGFVDYGCVRQNVDNGIAGAATPNRYCLKGAGAALAWQPEKGPSVALTWAHRLGHNPDPGSAGRDQDGSLVRNRFWLTASLPF